MSPGGDERRGLRKLFQNGFERTKLRVWCSPSVTFKFQVRGTQITFEHWLVAHKVASFELTERDLQVSGQSSKITPGG